MELKKKIKVMQAFDEGKEIEFKGKPGTDYYPQCWSDIDKPTWNWATYLYRIKHRIKPVANFKIGDKVLYGGVLHTVLDVREEYESDLPAYSLDNIQCWILDESQLTLFKEPKYRPYATAEEFLKDSKIHGPYIINSTKEYFLVNQVFYCGAKVSNYNGNYSFKGLLELFKWQDGSPCGILE